MPGKEKPEGRIGVAILTGDGDEEASASPKDMACKAMWTSIKDDDYDGFKMALDDYLRYRDKGGSAEVTETED